MGVSSGKLGRFVGFSKQKRDECGGNHVGGLWVQSSDVTAWCVLW